MTDGLGFETLRWTGGAEGHLELLEQTLLPEREEYLPIETVPALIDAIRRLAVRGAPALGCAGAYGVVLVAQGIDEADGARWLAALRAGGQEVADARPTAVNLRVGVDRVLARAEELAAGSCAPVARSEALLASAREFHEEDAELCRAIGRHGAALLPSPCTVLTHCNAGALATGGMGTALSVVYAAHRAGKEVAVFADETRPLLQGARLTSWELARAGIPITLQCDGAAGSTLASGRVQAVVVGSDRIAANGDVANKVGTYPLAVLARRHGVPFYVAAPTTTIDLDCPTGADIPIEQRDAQEVSAFHGRPSAPERISVWNPAFDVTPAELVTAIITEKGVLENPAQADLAAHIRG